MYDQASSSKLSDRPMSRIDNDVANIRDMAARVRLQMTPRIVRHAQTLGYYEPQPSVTGVGATPTPVISTLADAIRDLDRALDELSGSLNLFD